MCGIVGYIGSQDALPILLDGLKKLEYRGYDSAGVALVCGSDLVIKRCAGKVLDLEKIIDKESFPVSSVGIGHTRWATHGRPSDNNAHPHVAGSTVVVHNGIIENYLSLKKELMANGRVFSSETDTEVIAHMIDDYLQTEDNLAAAVRKALKGLQGSYALLVFNEKYPDRLIAARKESPLVLGGGNDNFFVASDIPAILSHTNNVTYLEDGDMAVISREGFTIFDEKGGEVQRPFTTITWSPVMAEKAGYKHFMLKEIFEQPRAIIDTCRGYVLPFEGEIAFGDIGLSNDIFCKIKKIFIVACGTSWHAGLIGKFLIEQYCRVPVEIDLSSEFRYRTPILDKETLVIAISQSGETADTLAAMGEAQRLGAKCIAVCNVVGSSIARKAEGIIYTHAGPEIGVASTKAFTTQLVALYMFAIYLGRLRGEISPDAAREMIADLMRLPHLLEKALGEEKAIKKIAKKYFKAQDFLYLGRGIRYPVALEGALKLKEISYIHAEGYPAGEMKHGPIALIDEHMPVVVLSGDRVTYEKILGNVEEVVARGGRVIAVCEEGDLRIKEKTEDIITIPSTPSPLMPVVMTVPLQILAYHIAVLRGTDVDQPRNLAKSVTVE
ncbi:MAG: glutamine--fructose-6-phosphate transaminase (isomerizing) [Pseudomonadota bacterium]